MHAGLSLTKYSGRLMGAHQKFDRVARRHLEELLAEPDKFPKISDILQFEGIKGPDALKRKSPAKDEPWHFLNPLGDDHDEFLEILEGHYKELVKQLKAANNERSAFEAAWLAHTVVDGLTPAHHYPYEEKIVELQDGKGIDTRNTIGKKLVFKGDTTADTILKNFKAYGPKGLITAHTLFEFGVMLIIRPSRFPDAKPNNSDIKEAEELTIDEFFMRKAREVAVLELYEKYLETGWTAQLSNDVRHKLAPTIIKATTLLWYKAEKEARA